MAAAAVSVAAIGLSGGAALEKRLNDMAAKLGKSVELRVGYLEGSTDTDGTSLPMIAAIQEFGAPAVGIPPRPFFRPMIAAKSPQWGNQLAGLLQSNDMDPVKALGQMGEGIKGQLEDSILDVTSPPLSPVTLLLRERFGNTPGNIKFSDVQKAREDIAAGVQPNVTGTQAKPLVWTGGMLNGIGVEVNEK